MSTGIQRLVGWRWDAPAPCLLDDCCLVIPTYQRPEETVRLLDRLMAVADPPGEVVIVDGSFDDRTANEIATWVQDRPHPFDLAYVRSPAGLTRQRNVGIDASSRKFVFFLDDDCLPESGYFEAIWRVFLADRGGAVGAVCGSIVNQMDRPMSLRWRLRFLLGLAPRNGRPGRYYPTATSVPISVTPPFAGVRAVDILPGGASAYRRDVFAVERFSLFFDGYAQGEDVEMSLRIGGSWKLLWCGDAHLEHYHAPAGRPDAVQKGRMEVRNRFFIWKRHTPAAQRGDRLRFWADIGYIFAYDLAASLVRPRRSWSFRHAIGVLRGAAECLAAPPRYAEPPAKKEYELVWQTPPGGHGLDPG